MGSNLNNKINQALLAVTVSCPVLHFQVRKGAFFVCFCFLLSFQHHYLFFLRSICLPSKMFPNCYFGLSTSTRPSQHAQTIQPLCSNIVLLQVKICTCVKQRKSSVCMFTDKDEMMRRLCVHACVEALCFEPDCVKAA